MIAHIYLWLALTAQPGASTGRLTATDLPAYLKALEVSTASEVSQVQFEDLWTNSANYKGQTVKVQGRAARRFRQGAVGDFPALVELWAVDSSGNPFCLVFPDRPEAESWEVGDRVEFVGRFLRLIEYSGGDQSRIAPLVVGPQSPIVTLNSNPATFPGWSKSDWILGAILAAIAGLVLVTIHLRKPQPRLELGKASRLDHGDLRFLDHSSKEPEEAGS